jgi:hypothetical protein
MQRHWDTQEHTDLNMPTVAEAKTVNKMQTISVPSYADTDTTLRGQEPTAEHLMQHSVGLVRVWLQWFPLADASTTETIIGAGEAR